jgi:hypothetical protein
MGDNKIIGLALCTAATDAATKAYVDGLITAGGGLANIADDLSPELGGNLDALGFDITNIAGASAETVQFDLTFADGSAEGRLQWNSEDGTLEFGLPGGNVNLQIGQEQVILCRNTTGSTIANGSVVYISGASGNKPLITLADASDLSTAVVAGVATEAINHNGNGYVTVAGLVRDINTDGMAVGALLYLSETPGAYTTTEPSSPAISVSVGHVIAAHASTGVMLATIHSPKVPDSGLANIVEDTSPQLGAALDGQGFDLNSIGVMFLKEQAAAEADVASHGQLWTTNGSPKRVLFTGSDGVDQPLANDDKVVHNTGVEVISGQKTFNAQMIIPYGQGVQYGTNIASSDGMRLGTNENSAFEMTPYVDGTAMAGSKLTYTFATDTWAIGGASLGVEVNDLSAAVTWANIPDANVPQTAVTQHEGALAIAESQITDGSILARVGASEVITQGWTFQHTGGILAQPLSGHASLVLKGFGSAHNAVIRQETDTTFNIRPKPSVFTDDLEWTVATGWKFDLNLLVGGTLGVTGALTALSYGGITEGNLLDKSVAETISTGWTFDTIVTKFNQIAEFNAQPGIRIMSPDRNSQFQIGVLNTNITQVESSAGNEIVLDGPKLTTDASSTARAGFNVPEGTAPTAPVDGDMWVTATDILARINGVSKSLITGDAEVNDLSSVVTWANIPIANVPTGTTSSTVSLGNHTHTYLPLTGGALTGPVTISEGALGVPLAIEIFYNGSNDFHNGFEINWQSDTRHVNFGLMEGNLRFGMFGRGAALNDHRIWTVDMWSGGGGELDMDFHRWYCAGEIGMILRTGMVKIGVNLNETTAPTHNLEVVGNASISTTLDVTGALTALSYGGVTEANLLDKTATEVITGGYTINSLTLGGQLNCADKDLNRPVLEDYGIKKHSEGSSAGTLTLDMALGNAMTHLFTEDVTTVTVVNPPASGTYGEIWLRLTQHASSAKTIAWASKYHFPGGTDHVMSGATNAVDLIHLSTIDGGATYDCTFVQDSK